ALPIWLESVQSQFVPETSDAVAHMVYRLRLRRVPQLHAAVQLRLYFQDKLGAAPAVSAWTETGVLRFESGPLGTGLNLSTSALLNIPVTDTDYIEIAVPGDGGTLRGAYVSSLKRIDAQAALDFVPSTPVLDAFGGVEEAVPRQQDSYLFGRVRATLEAGTIKLEPGVGSNEVTYEVELDAAPLVAMVTFEVLEMDLAWPPEVTVNDIPLGAVAPVLPDLADLAYRGNSRPAERDMRFHYTGWLRCQRLIPGSALRQGLNRLTFRLNRNSGPVAIRVVELQLKHHWENFDYKLTP
ncbi:MAG: hypothetical protein ACO1QR_12705, partial [Chthoniobacteraceae bacterium]